MGWCMTSKRLIVILLAGMIAGCNAASILAQAPAGCTPRASEDLGQPVNAGDSKTYSAMVPPGEAWIVRAAGIGYSDPIGGAQLEYALEVIHPVPSTGFTDSAAIADDGRCCWRVPVARGPNPVNGTPTLALERTIVLLAGERLSARVNLGMPVPGLKMNLFLLMWKLPAGCLDPTVLR